MTEPRVNRVGMWTKADLKYMEDNHLTMSSEDIAAQLQRNPETVAQHIKKFLGYTEAERTSKKATFDIRKSPVWTEIKKQFSEEEQSLFEYHWGNLMVQFKHETLPSERMQILEVVRLELLLNRIMCKLREIDVNAHEAQDTLDEERAKELENRNMLLIGKLEIIIANSHASHREMNREYKELSERKDKMIISIRGSRDQRIKRIEDSRETIQSWMGMLSDNIDMRRELGIEMKKQQLAMEVELKRLSDYNTYADGEVSRPILNCDTIGDDD